MPDPRLVELLDSGTRRLVRSVDAIPDDQWIQPSLLPGWSRSHVVAHLTLNAEGLTLIVVTHDSAVARRARRRLRLDKGTVRDITR